ncbi:LysM domain-containing protein [Pseudomonas sp. NFIX51]|uniref:LysM peptidoglycan-binding domain-containing protein n=1 Tax=unclassified Pseudomonas TaxID=196821 RepID=UPI0008AB97C9|nr:MULTISPECIES: LysM peptidoglycan-binding domain-containing protein [unclassified Pseudomonas]SEK81149.1 LysM domain-containing protein [Pseudomonas sp. NFACC41-3]SMH44333.1 LysM domain-containing protein [Pseudomonas sp. NFIX51]
MEITNHLVKPGETLSQIASRYNATVAQLRQLNPFIINPGNIKAGWNLSVPKSAQAPAAGAPAKSTANATTSSAAQPSPAKTAPDSACIKLGAEKDFSKTCDANFVKHAPPCSKIYANAIYATDEQQFWLLPERASASMKEAMYTLEKQISPSKSNVERIKGLDESGLLSYFLEPKLGGFLEDAERQRMEAIEKEEPNIDMDPAMALRSRSEKAQAGKKSEPEAPKADTQKSRIDQYISDENARNQIRTEYDNFYTLRKEWCVLRDKAIAIAKEQGYTYESGTLFSEKAIEARVLVQNYLEKRKAVFKKFDSKAATEYSPEEIAKLLAEDKQKREALQCCVAEGQGDLHTYFVWKQENAGKFAYYEYTDAIMKVAEYGIALPEFALIDDGLATGIQQFRLYLETEKKQSEVNDRLREKYRRWIEATGQNAQAPAGLVEKERAEWDRLQLIKEGLHKKAQAKLAKPPSLHLLWEPEQFQPQPVDRLVKAGFPLREVSRVDAKGNPLSWFSLLDLDGMGKIIKNDLQKAGKKVLNSVPKNGSGGAAKDSAQKVFGQWLESQGAHKIDDQAGDWFDSNGWFDIEAFYKYLTKEGYKVTQLEDAGARKGWGEHLKQVVFKKSVRGSARLFDKSPQAQFVRCLTPPQAKLHGETKFEGPSFSAAEGFQASASVSLSYDLARGEVELMKVDMPAREKARDLTVEYFIVGNPQAQSMNFGRFSFHFGARAWGYAGASLMLAGSIELNPIFGNAKYGANLSPIKPVQREDAEAKAERADHEKLKADKAAKNDNSPTPDLQYKSEALTSVDTKTSDQVLTGRKAKVQIENGAKANFNLFAGVQAAIELTGALNWSPPKALAALRTPPATGINSSKEATAASQWLTLAKLNGSVGVAAGVGFKGDAQISLDKGRFILNLKAAVVLGPGASGAFKLEVGYEAVVEIVNLYRRELYKTQGAQISWIDPKAAEQASMLNVLGAAGLDVALVYMMGLEVILSLYDAMTSGGKGGPIADAIIEYQNQEELEKWFIEATPAALGPILMTLTSEPEKFSIVTPEADDTGNVTTKTRTYTKELSHATQQKAVERILSWIVKNSKKNGKIALAQKQFEDACRCMNKFGTMPKDIGQKYCENRHKLDVFMSDPVLRMSDRSTDLSRERYKEAVSLLGARLNGSCKVTVSHRAYVPMTTVKYIGAKEGS